MSSKKKNITILGVTGSVGQSTVNVILANKDRFDVQTVTAHTNVISLAQSAKALNAKTAIIADTSKEQALRDLLKNTDITVQSGSQAVENCVSNDSDLVMAAIMGFAGLRPILNALEKGINVAIANKEPLVAAGPQIMAAAVKSSAKILPVDSEHNAIFQVFENNNKRSINKLILTASGGPFLRWKPEDVKDASVKDAVNHPNWDMGAKISIDSATMMNKALEIIEAHYLFDVAADKIDVLIHPQSTIHSMVSYCDGSILSQMGASDMRTPIAYALGWPNRINSHGDKLDINQLASLTFEQPDFKQFPALRYAYKCLELGQASCIVMNAANEIAVSQFLAQKIKFGDIMETVIYAIDTLYPLIHTKNPKTVAQIEELDNTVRIEIMKYTEKLLHA